MPWSGRGRWPSRCSNLRQTLHYLLRHAPPSHAHPSQKDTLLNANTTLWPPSCDINSHRKYPASTACGGRGSWPRRPLSLCKPPFAGVAIVRAARDGCVFVSMHHAIIFLKCSDVTIHTYFFPAPAFSLRAMLIFTCRKEIQINKNQFLRGPSVNSSSALQPASATRAMGAAVAAEGGRASPVLRDFNTNKVAVTANQPESATYAAPPRSMGGAGFAVRRIKTAPFQ